MDPYMDSDARFSNNGQGTSQAIPPPYMITPEKSNSRGFLADLAGWPSYSDMRTLAPGSENSSSLNQGRNPSEMYLGTAHAPAFQKPSHLPTPQSPGNMASYLLTRIPTSSQNLQPDLEPAELPTEFRSHASPSPSPLRPHSIPTPESSPLLTRSRSNAPQLLSQNMRTNSHDDNNSPAPSRKDDLRSRASTPPRTPSRQTSTRPITPVFESRPSTPLQRRPTRNTSPNSSHLNALHSHHSPPSLQSVKEEPVTEAARIRVQLIENHLASTQAAESHRPEYFKRLRRLTPSGDTGTGSVTSDLASKDGSLLWSSANVGVIDSPAKGKRIALFQETSDDSFEESLMAGGYGRYRLDGPSWKLEEDAEAPNQLSDAVVEEEFGSRLVLTEEEKRKRARLAAFLEPPRESTAQLFPVEIERYGRILMKVDPSEPLTPPRPTPKAKQSRKRKKISADTKLEVDEESMAAPEVRPIDGPNWPDTEFPWRSCLMARDGLSDAEREERLRCIESFFNRDSDKDDVEDSSSGPDEASSRSLRSSRGKMSPPDPRSRLRRRGSSTVIPNDPADAKTALLSKKSVRAVQLRLLRRRNTDRTVENDESETLCICQGRGDGPLVQCDACQRWFHLGCIGIQSTSELGREEDPWFCANCAEVKTPPPVAVPPTEPAFVPTDANERSIGLDPPFLHAGLNPSPVTPWTRTVRAPTTPPRTLHIKQASSGMTWDQRASSSSHGGPQTPQFNTASAFGDMVRVYGITPGRSVLEPSPSNMIGDSPFDPTSTPSRGIKFGLPFTTPKDGRLGSTSWQGVRGNGHELFHTPKGPGEDSNTASSVLHGRVEEISEEGPSGLYRATGTNNATPVERDVFSVPKRMQVSESPLSGKRSRRTVGP